MENTTEEEQEVDWVKLYQILQAEHIALLSNRRLASYRVPKYCREARSSGGTGIITEGIESEKEYNEFWGEGGIERVIRGMKS